MWQTGRQNTGYLKKCLWISRRFLFDVYLIKYPTGTAIPPHCDLTDLGDHHRLNIIIKRGEGGEFHCEGNYRKWWRFNYFRPDIQRHWVDEVTSGERLVLSIGWIRRQKDK